jgi:hypothetical protein
MSQPETKPSRFRKWRRWLLVAAGAVVLLVVAAVAVLPYGLSTPRARRWLLNEANRVLAPGGKLEVATFRFSWFGPTRLTGFTLRDAQGEAVVAAPTALWDRSLGQILFDRPRYGRVSLHQFRLDIDRRPDGSIDVLDALAPILTPDPPTDWTLDLVGGEVRVKSDGLAAPLTAKRGDIHLRRPPAPQPLSWTVALGDVDRPGPTLRIDGSYNRWTARPERPGDLKLIASARTWPLDLERPEGTLSASWTGSIQAHREAGRWATRGDAAFAPIRVETGDGPDVRLDSLNTDWDLAQTAEGWRLTSLNLSGEAGTLKARGATQAGGFQTHVEGDLQPAKLLTLFQAQPPELPLGLRLDSAHALILADLSRRQASEPGPLEVEGRIHLDGLKRQAGGEVAEVSPVTIDVQAAYDAAADAVGLRALHVQAEPGTLQVSGRLDGLLGPLRADLRGTIDADWSELLENADGRLADETTVEIGPIAFHLDGPLAGEPTLAESLDAEVRIPLRRAGAFGMEVGEAELVARSERGTITFDPIEASLNGGRLRFLPELVANDDWSAVTLRLAPGSSIDGAKVNDEVSRRVLAFVVPTMAEATRVNGRVSARFDRAEFPLAGPGGTVIEGNIIFDDVTFAPGPLADELFGVIGPEAGDPVLHLAQPVLLSVHDRKVYQHGLAVPIGKVARVEMEGWVDFDKNLELDVSVPLAPGARMREERPVLAIIASGVRPVIPIRGTLDDAHVDTEAFGRNMGRMGLDVAERAGLGFGAALLERMTRPRTPEEQAAIDEERARREAARQERKARQEQKRQERRMRRGRG